MKKWFLCLATAAAFAKAPPPQPAFDADLFSRDKQVISTHLEFLYWVAEEGALDYAIKMRSPAWSSSTDNYASGNMKRTNFFFDPGFRLGMSFFRAPNYWEVWAMYTRMTSRGHTNAGKPGPTTEYINGTWPQILTAPLAGAETSIHLNYNLVDFLVDRFFNPNPHLRIRLIGGLTGAWMDQNWSIRYYDSSLNNSHIKSRWSYGGAGLRMGTMADWFWTHDIYLTARGTVGVLMGNYTNRTKQTSNISPTGAQNPAVPLRNVRYNDARPAVTGQLLIGPSYQKSFSTMRLEAFVGYEITGWGNLQEVYRSSSGSAQGAKETWINTGLLTFQGITARITTDF